MLQLYWRIGRTISEFESDGFSSMDVISRLSNELAKIYSTTISFSEQNIGHMQKFYAAYPDVEIVQEVLAQIPWDYHIALLELVSTYEERIYYARLVIEHGWGPDQLIEVIKSEKGELIIS